MPNRVSVVVSQGQSQNPAKRQLEEDLVAALLREKGIEVIVVPNLYDLTADTSSMQALKAVCGDMIVMSWHYPRAARWVLDRAGVRGQAGTTLLVEEDEDQDEEDLEGEADDSSDELDRNEKERVIDTRVLPKRTIYCIDLRIRDTVQPFVDEVKRVSKESATEVISELKRIDEQVGRRWYPVIDFSRCTNCMECIDFCLFGVYGVDGAETILVEQPDNCRKGCPACSRVCPENAIVFPQHKSAVIAGAPSPGGTLKIDLSQLFGAPSAVEVAARERDEQLVLAGRDAVGMTVGIPKRQSNKPRQANDDLDDLIDELDALEL